jgi:hypothetical protein
MMSNSLGRLSVVLIALLMVSGVAVATAARAHSAQGAPADSRLKGSFRRAAQNGWTFVHLEGSPAEIGFQHGFLLAPEIEDTLKVTMLELTHDNQKDWKFFRDAAENMMWPHIELEYREELQGIVDGVRAGGGSMDLWDVVALNGSQEWDYYSKQYDRQHGIRSAISLVAPSHCSAFVATGSYTRDGRVVIAHNNWTNYLDGERWTIIFDIVPAKGKHILMDGLPGLIHSADDFGVNSAGIVITETTISGFSGYDPAGIPEFIRARKAMQYSSSIDDFARIMEAGNNGGYANDWLVADTRANEIASLELGLKNVTLSRTKDGYFVGSNFPINPQLARQETDFDLSDMSNSANARHVRWKQLMAENKGKIDLLSAERFESDHYDTYTKKTEPSERTLCGHIDLSPRGDLPWQPPFGIAGTVQNKATDAAMASEMEFAASAGHACGIDFHASDHLEAHPEFSWQKDLLRNMDSHPWVRFQAQKAER